MRPESDASPRWWEREPLLISEIQMASLVGDGWQNRADPGREVRAVAKANARQTHLLSVIEGHLTDRYCYFKSARFRENRRDYLADYLARSRKAGYRTVVYFNVHAIRPEFAEAHPDWRQLRADGSPIDNLYGVESAFCVNTPWRDWVRAVCLDLCAYPIDGIFFDGPCLFAGACYCAACQALYRTRHGRELPPKEPGHPELKDLAAFQADSLRRFYEHANRAIKAARPDVALYGNAAPREEPYYRVGRNNRVLAQAQDVLAAEGGFVYGELARYPVWKVGSNAKYYQTQSGGKPTLVFNSPAHGPWRCHTLSEPELLLAWIQGPIHGSGIWFSARHGFIRQPPFARLAELYRFFGDQRAAYFDTVSRARVAVVWPADSLNFYGKPAVLHGDFTQGGQAGETVGDIHEEFNGLYDVLIRNQVPCDILDEESVRSGDLSPYDLLLLPNIACTGPRFDERLRAYVRNGGNVIASFETSLCGEAGRRGRRLRLGDLFGIRLLRSPLKPYPHFYVLRPGGRSAWFAGIRQPLLPSPLISTEVGLAGAESLAPYSVKVKGWDGREVRPSAFPALTIHRYGRGRALYLAGVFGGHYWTYKHPEIGRLLANLVAALHRPDVVAENAPPSVELVHRQSRDGGREMVSLINYSGGPTRPFERLAPVESLTVRVRTGKTTARALRTAGTLKARRRGPWLTVPVPRLDLFETVVLE